MPLRLENCGVLGGDVEMTATLRTLAIRHPDTRFVIIGRNSGEDPQDVGLPSNVTNPWTWLRGQLRRDLNSMGLKGNFSVEEQQRYAALIDTYLQYYFRDADGIVLWLGQHGTTNSPIPGVRDRSRLTKPQDSSAHYAGYLLRGVNEWRRVNPWEREPVLLNSDVRNYLKLRDLQYPLRYPVISQFDFTNNIKHERYGDGDEFEVWRACGHATLERPEDRDQVWLSRVLNTYDRLEINGLLPGTPFGNLLPSKVEPNWCERSGSFGMFINETRTYVNSTRSRRTVLRDWVLLNHVPLSFLHGTWSKASLAELGVDIQPAPWEDYVPKLSSVRCTFTTPASGSGWATAKPWEAFAVGTVCFFHPEYDTQDNILRDLPPHIARFLRVTTPEQLRERVVRLNGPDGRWDWEEIVLAQRALFDHAVSDLRFVKTVESRLELPL